VQDPARKVDILPAQAQKLSSAHARGDRQHEQRLQALALHLYQ